MTHRTVPQRHWRTYGNDPLPTGAEALDEPFNAFPSWFLRIECDRCGKVQMGQPGALRAAYRGRQQPAGASDRAARGVGGPRTGYDDLSAKYRYR